MFIVGGELYLISLPLRGLLSTMAFPRDLVYETRDDAVRLVAQAGKGTLIMKRDLKATFRHVPIAPL